MQYHTNSIGADASAFERAFVKALEESESSSLFEVIFLVPTIKNLKGGVYETVLGEKALSNFADAKTTKIGNIKLFLETKKIKSLASKAVVFAPYISSEMLKEALLDYRTAHLVYVPWAPTEFVDYLASYPMSIQI